MPLRSLSRSLGWEVTSWLHQQPFQGLLSPCPRPWDTPGTSGGRVAYSKGHFSLCQLLPEGSASHFLGISGQILPHLFSDAWTQSFWVGLLVPINILCLSVGFLNSSWAHSHHREHFGTDVKAMRTLTDYLLSWLCFLHLYSSHPGNLRGFGAISSSPPLQAGTATASLACKFRNISLQTTRQVLKHSSAPLFLWSLLMRCTQSLVWIYLCIELKNDLGWTGP